MSGEPKSNSPKERLPQRFVLDFSANVSLTLPSEQEFGIGCDQGGERHARATERSLFA